MAPQRFFVGVRSGGSLLGVDAALVRADGIGIDTAFRLEHFLHVPFGTEVRELLRRVASSATPELGHVAALHRVLGETYALAVRQLLEQSKIAALHVSAIGLAGAPLWHDADGRFPSSFSLGMPGVVAERTGLTTISDFASRDMALGGQGMPITALVDALLFHRPSEDRAVIHLGSVATVVWLPANIGPNYRNMIGFEAAPATMLLDGLMRLMTNGRESLDMGGKHAVQGRCLEPLLERWLQNHFFLQRPPKCVPRREFGLDFLHQAIERAKRLDGSLHDVLCTMTHFVARAIVHALETHLPARPSRILLAGKGVRNGFLWRLLERGLAQTPMERTGAHGIPAEACASLAHAGLACLALDGVPVNVPSVTGASGQRTLGQLTPGSSAHWARCLAWMSRLTAPSQAAA